MRSLLRWLAALTLIALPLLVAPHAHAQESWHIPRYDVTATPRVDGTTEVVLNFDFDFGNERGHGPFITVPLRQGVPNDPDVWRMMDVQVQSVTSGTGANTTIQEEEEDGVRLIRVGSERESFTGVQNYVITYTATGLIAGNQATSGLDEFNWNAVGTGWEVPIDAVNVTVNGPVPVEQTACFVGSGLTQPCEANSHTDNTATYQHTNLGNGRALQVVAGFPAGTFQNVEPVYTRRVHPGNMFPLTPVTGGLTAVLGAAGVVLVASQVRRRGRDQAYLGMTPGLSPVAGEEAAVGVATKQPVTVQFSPPKHARPGELGTLIDAKADNRDVTATIIDLAVRGHLRIEEVERKQWRLVRLSGRDQLLPYERAMLGTMFQSGNAVTTKQLSDKKYATLLTDARTGLYQRVTQDLHWFQRRPDRSRTQALVLGLGIAAAGVLLGMVLAATAGWGLIGLALVIPGLLLAILSGRMPARTPEGSAVLAQTKGFELYLSTAEADKIRFEEGVDIFSRYLPYAIVFGVAERWSKVFEELARRGSYTPTYGWYSSPHSTGFFYGAAFASSMNDLTASMSSAMASSVASASAGSAATAGGSGFSGGGGFGGGGGGGW